MDIDTMFYLLLVVPAACILYLLYYTEIQYPKGK